MRYYIYDGDTLKYLKRFATSRKELIAHFCLYHKDAVFFNSRKEAEAARLLLEPEYDRLIILEMPK